MNVDKKVAFYTLGCKLNFSETSTIARNFVNEGFERVEFEEEADIYVINTCSVTDNADKRFKSIVKSALKKNEEAFVIGVGCYAQLKPEELAAVDGVDLVLGATEKFNVTSYINDLTKNDIGEVHSCEIEDADFYVGSYSIGDRTRAFLKVQDGCDYKCTYCTIPLARGISRSDTLENVLKNAKEISEKGIKEIVLTGVNIGDYGKGEFGNKKHEHTFLELVQALDKVEGINRLRISSIEPNLLKDETIDFVSNSNTFVPHFHIPLQSGSDTLLKKMKRRYLRKVYTDRVAKIKEVMPNACIGVDVIVGFPGETDELFLETYNYLADLDISYLHVFTYSERPNTEANEMDGVVPKKTRAKRSKMLRGLSVKKRRAFYESQLGNTLTVLFESENKEGYIHGFTENYVKVKAPWNPELVNTLHTVTLTKIDEDGLVRFDFVDTEVIA
ncbi:MULTISPECIES: tRNA (N(6)-L-threonylcarbamoyladenosine(37)-C(2))-methylthiotransferase MtaB [Tenacibaculum]|uniref:Threonylcarbamoyladenosine tRNA methylthiotransferase MtaB n=1 Tax=Tenacibaculum sp. Pbs-1 TaxID=3238748 RepID=A0AB33L3K0_9FLAO|nr:tRNA (N(6)-L-threonylcarbamoyladenosine(37)-C(2))-methylthiotransferase MtaB [Tenacibaculum mesophilum]GFD75397.1 tRNA (N(6)-L-threonylcarbamoyladenosine(37)-C(2))-methylthiotran sferase MtaB [Tenacibaculum sp. KUL113]GFD96330.1 tRNA (N(6)-L-threonylcarbamoyladenosine(37)-C(2))-methylthiotran sferase MtaB [Alteromonas sp. KUL154]GFE00019.1 tRNA (N(6)-L-threonylcarbamoyladenosine(37)-C(2))-methylthiotran sferase MtaB [Alteromonas sp. KUL156]KAF9658310.1 tRNA (N(6)-L-threonylcarbamoyladenosine|eukprot:TRINITY_DN6783_c0_g1_i1.p1 TRINITY_DN6783_c0_g1~~TRINITY_DN6783_c0_g1_i1.p1  ORF type:complete len:445 (-),score=88.69 TRINITY_DN6783_c0_g1_i1:1092-2426(-)